MITKEEILRSLNEFSAIAGKCVIVHTSLKAIGEIKGGGETLLSALIEFFTDKGGLLCIPTHTWDSLVLDLNKAESCTGVLSQLAAAHPDGVRALHPTHSLTVFGDKNKVAEFVKNEKNVDSPTHPDGCYGNLYKNDGYVLLIGVGQEKNTFLHCVEEMLNVKDRLTQEKIEATIIHKDLTVEKRYLHWFDETLIPDVSINFGKFEKAFRYYGCIQDGILGDAKMQLCSTVKMKSVMEKIYHNADGRELLADALPLDEKLYK